MATDTDSLFYLIETPDLYADMSLDSHLFDTSNFDKDHPLYSKVNNKIVGKFKSETGSHPPKEFVGLKAKMYSLHISEKTSRK